MERKMMKINVEIAEKTYRLTIPADEEERVRRAAKHIKDQMETLKRTYDASLIEYLAMAAMRISIENEENKERVKVSPEAMRLQGLALQLDRWAESEAQREVERPQELVLPPKRRGRPRKQPKEE